MEAYLLTWNPNDSAVDKTALEWRRLRAGTRPTCRLQKAIHACCTPDLSRGLPRLVA